MRRAGYSTAPSIAAHPFAAAHSHVPRLKPSRLFGVLALLSALAGLGSPAALGQQSWSAAASPGAGLGALALSQSILSGSRRPGEPSANTPSSGTNGAPGDIEQPANAAGTAPADAAPAGATMPAGMTPDQINAALGYLPDPGISAEIREHEIDAGAAQDPAYRPLLEKAFADDAALQQFEVLLAAHGGSSHNLADAIAGLMWTSWQFVNDAALTDTQIRGIDRQIRTIFLASPNLPSLTDETRQRLSENAAYRVMIATAAMRTDDPAVLTKSRQNIAVIVRSIVDLDLAKLDVTPDGQFSTKEATVQ
jgi:uncharacterized protein DUF6683